MVRSPPRPRHRSPAEGEHPPLFGHRVCRVALPVEVLVLEEEHGILGGEGAAQQADGVAGARRKGHEQARDVGEDRLTALRVPDASPRQVAPDGHPHHEGAGERTVRAPPDGGRLASELLHGGPDVVEELDLGARAQTTKRLAHTAARRCSTRPAVCCSSGPSRSDAAGPGSRRTPRLCLRRRRARRHRRRPRPHRRPGSARRAPSARAGSGRWPRPTGRVRPSDRRTGSGPGSTATDGLTTWSVTVAGSGREAARASSAARGHRVLGLARGWPEPPRPVRTPRSPGRARTCRWGRGPLPSASSSAPRYLDWESAAECEYGRVTRAWMSPGPSPARTRADGPGTLGPARGVVPSVHLGHGQAPETPDQLGYRCRRLVGRPHGDGVAVVGHDVEHGQVEPAGRVQALPELALGRGPLAERHVGELVAVRRQPGQRRSPGDVAAGLGAPHRRQALAAGRAGLGDDVAAGVSPVAGHLPATRRRVLRRARPPPAGSRAGVTPRASTRARSR